MPSDLELVERLGQGGADHGAVSRQIIEDAAPEGGDLLVVGGENGGLELTGVGFERGELGGFETTGRLDMIDLVRFEQQQRLGPVMVELELGKEVRVAGGNDALDRQLPGMTMVGMESVPLPRIVAENHVRTEPADGGGDL